MPPGSNSDPYRPLVVLGVLIATVFILSVASKVLIPIAMGVLLSFALNPAVQVLIARGLKRLYAVWVVVAVTGLVFGALVLGLTAQLRSLADDLGRDRAAESDPPTMKENIRAKVRGFSSPAEVHVEGTFDKLAKTIEELLGDIRHPGPKDDAAKADERQPMPVRVVGDRWSGFGVLPVLAGPLAATLGSISLTIGLTVSMLVMRDDLRNRLFLLLGDRNLTSSTRAMDEASQRLSGYLIVQGSLNAAFGASYGVLLWLFAGDRYALVWAVLAFALRFVPYVGVWLAALFPLIVSLGTAWHWGPTIWVVVITLSLHVTFSSILEPMLVSRTTGITPIGLVVSVAFWTWLWGPIGLVLSTPITVGLSVAGKYFPSLRYFDVMLGRAAPVATDLTFYQRLLARDEAEALDLIEAYLAEPDKTPDRLLEEVLMPAMARARSDRERGQLSEGELKDLVHEVREVVEAALGPPVAAAGAPEARLVACAGSDDLDEVAIELLARMMPKGPAQVELIKGGATAAEVIARVQEVQPAAVLLSVLPPAGSARARYLCKRLKAAAPALPVVAGLWGHLDPNDPLPVQLTSAGALHVGTSLSEVRTLVVPLLQVAPHLHGAETPRVPVVAEPVPPAAPAEAPVVVR